MGQRGLDRIPRIYALVESVLDDRQCLFFGNSPFHLFSCAILHAPQDDLGDFEPGSS